MRWFWVKPFSSYSSRSLCVGRRTRTPADGPCSNSSHSALCIKKMRYADNIEHGTITPINSKPSTLRLSYGTIVYCNTTFALLAMFVVPFILCQTEQSVFISGRASRFFNAMIFVDNNCFVSSSFPWWRYSRLTHRVSLLADTVTWLAIEGYPRDSRHPIRKPTRWRRPSLSVCIKTTVDQCCLY